MSRFQRNSNRDNARSNTDQAGIIPWQADLTIVRRDLEQYVQEQIRDHSNPISEQIERIRFVFETRIEQLERRFNDELAPQQQRIDEQERRIDDLKATVDRLVRAGAASPAASPAIDMQSTEFSDNVPVSPSSSGRSDQRDVVLASSPHILRRDNPRLRAPTSLETLSESSSHSPPISSQGSIHLQPNDAVSPASSTPPRHVLTPHVESPGAFEYVSNLSPTSLPETMDEEGREPDTISTTPLPVPSVLASPGLANHHDIILAPFPIVSPTSVPFLPTPSVPAASPVHNSPFPSIDASTIPSILFSLVSDPLDIDPVVAMAAQNLAAACTPLFQQALQQIFNARTPCHCGDPRH